MQNKSRLDNIKKLCHEARSIVFYYQYAVWYNSQIALKQAEEENSKENTPVKKLVLSKKFSGKDLIVS